MILPIRIVMQNFCIFLLLTFVYDTVQAQKSGIYITVDQAQIQKSPIAMPSFKGRGSTVRTLYNTIEGNLDRNSFFQIIKPKAFLEDAKNVALTPYPQNPNGFRFENWKKIGTEFLIRGQYQDLKGSFAFTVYVYHVPQAKLVLKKLIEIEKIEQGGLLIPFPMICLRP